LPLVSVLLPVFNCEEYVEEAIRSVLAQTFADFELIVIDDGSTDRSPEALARVRDPRITLLRQDNQGLPATLNRAIGLARGRYIARQDQDDISLPHRLATQVSFMDENPQCALVGTWTRILRGRSETGRMHRHPVDHAALAFEVLFDSPFVHPSVMMRRSALDEVGPYSTELRGGPEDYDLWVRIARRFMIANIGEPLLLYREVEGSISRSGGAAWREKVLDISSAAFARAADVALPNTAVHDVLAIWHYAFDKVSGQPDFTAMRNLLIRASSNVAGGDDRALALSRAERRFSEVAERYRHFQLRSTPAARVARILARVRSILPFNGAKR
jgi:glycosyltransferase involved in cell wall biosynthesis